MKVNTMSENRKDDKISCPELYILAILLIVVFSRNPFNFSEDLMSFQCVDVTDDVGKVKINKGPRHKGDPLYNCAVLMAKALALPSYYVEAEMMVFLPSDMEEGEGHMTRPGIAYNVKNIKSYDVAYMK